MLKKGAKPHVPDNTGVTPLHLAAMQVLKDQDRTALVKSLLKAGAQPNYKDKINGQTPLHYAFTAGLPRYSAVKQLLKAGANSSIKDTNGDTPLHLAAKMEGATQDHARIVRALLKKGNGNPFIKNNNGHTPFDISNNSKNRLITKELEKYTKRNRDGAHSSLT